MHEIVWNKSEIKSPSSLQIKDDTEQSHRIHVLHGAQDNNFGFVNVFILKFYYHHLKELDENKYVFTNDVHWFCAAQSHYDKISVCILKLIQKKVWA